MPVSEKTPMTPDAERAREEGWESGLAQGRETGIREAIEAQCSLCAMGVPTGLVQGWRDVAHITVAGSLPCSAAKIHRAEIARRRKEKG